MPGWGQRGSATIWPTPMTSRVRLDVIHLSSIPELPTVLNHGLTINDALGFSFIHASCGTCSHLDVILVGV